MGKAIKVTERQSTHTHTHTHTHIHTHTPVAMPRILTVDMQAVLPGVGDAGAPKINVGSVGPRICPTQVADLQGVFWAHHTQTTPVP